MANFLDDTGLQHLWEKIKAKLNGKSDTSHNHDGRYYRSTKNYVENASRSGGTYQLSALSTNDVQCWHITNTSRDNDLEVKTPSGGAYIVFGVFITQRNRDRTITYTAYELSGSSFICYIPPNDGQDNYSANFIIVKIM